ncbi:AMP-binding protein [Rhodococcus qingshengii]|uniref:AMP-binding protein n=1 Tax=Rhodococcus qingshengii TaxID=334542 RepID=UPI00211E51D7|nr:AMP-binding protein [Rhodococcus qingshengii]
MDEAGPCSVGYTSGAGHPKGAVQSHRSVLLNSALTATMHGHNNEDIVVTALPTPHVYGNVVVNGTFIAGGTVVLMERFHCAAGTGADRSAPNDHVRRRSDDVRDDAGRRRLSEP